MIRLDTKKKIVIIEKLTSLDQVIMAISANTTDLSAWTIIPADQINFTETEEDINDDVKDVDETTDDLSGYFN